MLNVGRKKGLTMQSNKNQKPLGRVRETIERRKLADANTPVVLMVSGGSDSAALAYICAELCDAGVLGHMAALHVNHCIRGDAADADQAFVENLCELLHIPLHVECIDIPQIVEDTGENVEAVARRERYGAATQLLHKLCAQTCTPNVAGRIFTAHTQDDRVENFYMRSIVGTGPGGFRSMKYLNGNVARPCLDLSKQDLRDFLLDREAAGQPVVRTGGVSGASDKGAAGGVSGMGGAEGAGGAGSACGAEEGASGTSTTGGVLWCEDATNAHTDMFRAFVRHEIVPVARQRNTALLDTLTRTMNLIADEDDFMDALAQDSFAEFTEWADAQTCRLAPAFASAALPLKRRVIIKVLQGVLGEDARVETASVNAILSAFEGEVPKSGYSTNIQGNLAVSANKRGVLIEPMSAYRHRRGRS